MTSTPPFTDAPAPSPAGSPRRRWPGSATTPDSVTRPADYALINGVYFAGLTGVAALWRARSRRGAPTLPLIELPVMGAAAFALADVLVNQKITTWLRERFVEESADHKPVRPEGTGLGYAIGELVTCTRCVGSWCALGLIGLWPPRPGAPSAPS